MNEHESPRRRRKNSKKLNAIAIGAGVLLLLGSIGGVALYNASSTEDNRKPTSEASSNKKEETSTDKKVTLDDNNSTDVTDIKENTDKKNTTDPDTSTASESGSGNSDNTSIKKPSDDKKDSNTNSTHKHDWQKVYKRVKVKDAWTEKIRNKDKDEYEYVFKCLCDTTFPSEPEWWAHCEEMTKKGDNNHNRWTVESIFKEGYDTIEHPAEYENKLSGYKCSCGATK